MFPLPSADPMSAPLADGVMDGPAPDAAARRSAACCCWRSAACRRRRSICRIRGERRGRVSSGAHAQAPAKRLLSGAELRRRKSISPGARTNAAGERGCRRRAPLLSASLWPSPRLCASTRTLSPSPPGLHRRATGNGRRESACGGGVSRRRERGDTGERHNSAPCFMRLRRSSSAESRSRFARRTTSRAS